MGKSPDYRPRIADALLRDQLEATGVVLIQGPKWCGKTTTAEQMAASCLYMDDPRQRKAYSLLAETDPVALLTGAEPRLIDEWQLAPQLWDAARYSVSHSGGPGHLIFTGSAVPPDMGSVSHTGTGRFAWLTMRPMSLWESGDSTGAVSLAALFGGQRPAAAGAGLSFRELAFLICRGGWPGSLQLGERAALRQAANYVDAVAESDIRRVDGINRSPQSARRLLRSLARYQGAQAPLTSLCRDMAAGDAAAATTDTVASYLSALKKIFVVEDMPAWNPNLRSKTAVRTADTRYFTDPSIAAAALGASPADLAADPNTTGLLFETLAARDLRTYAEALDGRVSHYRDKDGLECDAVVHLRDGRYALVEVKLGGDTLVEEGAATLRRLEAKIDTGRMPAPSFLMVLTALGSVAYTRPDGVRVVPVSFLKD